MRWSEAKQEMTIIRHTPCLQQVGRTWTCRHDVAWPLQCDALAQSWASSTSPSPTAGPPPVHHRRLQLAPQPPPMCELDDVVGGRDATYCRLHGLCLLTQCWSRNQQTTCHCQACVPGAAATNIQVRSYKPGQAESTYVLTRTLLQPSLQLPCWSWVGLWTWRLCCLHHWRELVQPC